EARHQEACQIRSNRQCLLGERNAIHATRHHNVGEQHTNSIVHTEYCKCRYTVLCLEHAIAHLNELPDCGTSKPSIILNYQYGLQLSRRVAARASSVLR